MNSTLDVSFERDFFYTMALHFIDRHELPEAETVSRDFCLNTFTMLQGEKTSVTRIKALGKFVVNNLFVNEVNTNTILDIYMHINHCIGLLSRLVTKWKRRRMTVHNDTDLLLTPLSSYPETILTTIVDNGQKYVFRIPDLLSLVYNALSAADDRWYAAPTKIKNPYTGLPFSLENIYGIYISVRNSTFKMPVLFSLFVDLGCDIDRFGLQYECLLRDIMIENNVRNLSKPELASEIRYMLRDTTAYSPLEHDEEIIVRIHEAFPDSVLTSVFAPFLVPYYTHKYSLNPFMRHRSGETLVKKLLVFRTENPMFGRRILNSSTRFTNNRFVTTRTPQYNEYVQNPYHSIDVESTSIPYRNRRRNAVTRLENPASNTAPQLSANIALPDTPLPPYSSSPIRTTTPPPSEGSGQLNNVLIDALLSNDATNSSLLSMINREMNTQTPINAVAAAERMADNIIENIVGELTPREPVAVEPTAQEPAARAPLRIHLRRRAATAQEPAAQEPAAQEPAAQEPAAQEPVAEVPVAEEPVAEELSDIRAAIISGLEEEKEELREQEEKEEMALEEILIQSPRRGSARSALSNYRTSRGDVD